MYDVFQGDIGGCLELRRPEDCPPALRLHELGLRTNCEERSVSWTDQ